MYLRRPLEMRLAVMLACTFLAAGSTSVSAATTHWVNDDSPKHRPYTPPGRNCNNPGYPTIQSAVDAAAPGDRINVCPGTYMEEVTIPPGKDNILLRSVQFWAAVIKAPPVMLGPTESIVRVNGAHDVTILAFTITGPGGGPCDSLRYGVRVDDGGSVDILGNHITQIHDTPFGECRSGIAVEVGESDELTFGSARILGNAIDTYQRGGVRVSNEGSFAEIAYNRILGVGPTMVRFQNGVAATSGSTATVQHNFVAGNINALQTVHSAGIVLIQSGQVFIDHNTLSFNDSGVGMVEPASGSMTTHNHVMASTFDGIALETTISSRVAFNRVERNGGSGVVLDNSQGNEIDGNEVRRNGTENGDTTDGIRVTEFSAFNTLRNNHMKDNVTHDCHDDSVGPGTAGTANSWIDDHGETSQPPGLCAAGEDDGDDDHDGDNDHHGDNDRDRDGHDHSWKRTATAGWDASYAWYFRGLPIGAAFENWPASMATDTATRLMNVGVGRQ